MLKNKLWLGIILSIILMAFSINGFTAYYKYTQESGTNFYVGTADKADALEDTNEMRQILDDLGNLLGHSKRNDLYPKDSTTGGYLDRLNCGINASKPVVPVVNDMYLATDTVEIYRCFVAGNWVKVYPEGGTTTFIGLTDTPANYTGSANKFLQVNATPDALIFDTISSDDLSDVASIAMLDENETITGFWIFENEVYQEMYADSWYPYWGFTRARDGDPTYIVQEGDILGNFGFSGARSETPSFGTAAAVRGVAEDTFGLNDTPGRLEFLTTPDGSSTLVLRIAIDNAGNIKMGDGEWTNYINVTAGGAMTAEGTASIKATDLVLANQAQGDILYFNGTNWIRLAKGTAGQILTMNAGGTAPEWQTP